MRRTLPACCVLALCCISAQAQGTKADYERFDKIGGITGGKVFRTKVEAHWLTGTQCFLVSQRTGPRPEGFRVRRCGRGQAKSGVRPPSGLAKDLAKATGKAFDAHKLPFDAIEYKKADGDEKGLLGEAVYFKAEGKSWKINLKDQSLTEDKPGAGKKVSALRGIPAPRQEASKRLYSQSPQLARRSDFAAARETGRDPNCSSLNRPRKSLNRPRKRSTPQRRQKRRRSRPSSRTTMSGFVSARTARKSP